MMTKYPDLEDKNDLKDESFPFSKQDNQSDSEKNGRDTEKNPEKNRRYTKLGS